MYSIQQEFTINLTTNCAVRFTIELYCTEVLTIHYSSELLPSWTAEWLESSPPNIGVDGLNHRGLKCYNQKGFIGGCIYPEYSVAWLIPVVGFVS